MVKLREELIRYLICDKKKTQTTTTTTTTIKPFAPSIWGRLHEPKENYAGRAHGSAFSTHSYRAICLQ